MAEAAELFNAEIAGNAEGRRSAGRQTRPCGAAGDAGRPPNAFVLSVSFVAEDSLGDPGDLRVEHP
jgi:hypothetical protein